MDIAFVEFLTAIGISIQTYKCEMSAAEQDDIRNDFEVLQELNGLCENLEDIEDIEDLEIDDEEWLKMVEAL